MLIKKIHEIHVHILWIKKKLKKNPKPLQSSVQVLPNYKENHLFTFNSYFNDLVA